MKLILHILFLLLTWYTNLNAPPVFAKVVFPSCELTFSKTENVKLECKEKIGVQNFARSCIEENHFKKQIFSFPTNSNFLSNKNESENSNALISQKVTEENQKVSLQNSKKEDWVFEENRAREVELVVVNGAGNVRYGKNFISKLASNNSLTSIEKSIAEESHQILNSPQFKQITDGFANKTPVQIEINIRTISYDDAPFSGMTWFEKNGFNIGSEAFASEEELIKTILHEMHRLTTSTLRGSGTAAQVTQETQAAFNYANKTFNLFE
jgi:hypothetical protein